MRTLTQTKKKSDEDLDMSWRKVLDIGRGEGRREERTTFQPFSARPVPSGRFHARGMEEPVLGPVSMPVGSVMTVLLFLS